MSKLSALIRLAYDSAYDLKPAAKKYSEPKICDFGGDTSKRWYVYYSFRNPATGKLERQTPIYDVINQYDKLRDRRKAARTVRDAVSSILEQGLFDPFRDENGEPEPVARILNIPQAVEFVLTIKRNTLGDTTYRGFKSRVKQFEKWLLENGWRDRLMLSVTEVAVIDHLNSILARSSSRNRNNSRTDLSSFFAVLVDNRIVARNVVEGINVMKSVPTRHRSFTPDQEEKLLDSIFAAMPHLGLYIMMISVCAIRPIEANRLRICDVDIRNRRIIFRAKNQKVKTKIIPDMLMQHMPDLSRFDSDAHLFGYSRIGQKMEGTAATRQRRYGKLFRKFAEEFGLGPEYTLYSWRHTAITKMYRSLRAKGLAPFAAKTELMLITGHSSMKALEVYLRSIDAELPEDYSELLK